MRKLTLLVAAGVGYVLGTRAGRERYEQIKKTAMRVKDDPRVQEKAHQAADVARETAREKAPVVKDAVTSAAATVADKVTPSSSGSGSSSSSDTSDLEEKLHPDSTARQDDPYPKGDLP
ncbi:putative membrane protein [Nocardioides cavernae]|uniref:Putative membrane protein n=1 Tax=Nocardioides cavernae TaxID=1921566 RepID=A0A7Y9KTQ7_9ACTN|nr:YtxH domain-containing protein [Nocardioides cavernae]NYE37857.1 putative membrane protein [Nocardioides cavernae]